MLLGSPLVRAVLARMGGPIFRLARRVVKRSEASAIARRLCDGALPDPTQQLSSLLSHAATHVPYWRSRLVSSDSLVSQHARLPPLTKADIRAHEDELRSDDLGTRRWWTSHSGGSSGEPIAVVQDRTMADWSDATVDWYFVHHLGVDPNEVAKVVLWGSERDLFGHGRPVGVRVRELLTQTVMLNSFRMNDETMDRYIEDIATVRPLYVRGYAGSLYELAMFAERENTTVFRPQFVCSAAETLRPEMRSTIERVFRAPVFDFYGSREVGPIAGQGRDGAVHAFSFFNLVEVVDDQGAPVGPGGHGRVLVTTLRNHAMPLIRYDIGDTAEVGTVDTNGRVLTLKRITGRTTDHFVAADGALVHGEYFTHLFYGISGIREFQVIQTRTDDVEILWAPRDSSEAVPASTRGDIETKIRLVLGKQCAVRWTQVPEVPRTAQGKRLFTQSLVSR